MISRPRLRNMRLASAVLAGQILTGFVLAAVFGWQDGSRPAAAALFGAIIAAVPGLWMALWLLPRQRAGETKHLARSFIVGELGKLGLTAGLFIAAALLFGQQFLPLLATYGACLVCYWLALVLTR